MRDDPGAIHLAGDSARLAADGGAIVSHAFRFGVVAAQACSGRDWADKARRVEDPGFAIQVLPDGLQHTFSPFPALAAAAGATRALRVGTYVVARLSGQ